MEWFKKKKHLSIYKTCKKWYYFIDESHVLYLNAVIPSRITCVYRPIWYNDLPIFDNYDNAFANARQQLKPYLRKIKCEMGCEHETDRYDIPTFGYKKCKAGFWHKIENCNSNTEKKGNN